SGLGSASGFKIIIEDRGDLGVTELQRQLDRVIAAGNEGRFKLSKKSLEALEGDAKDPLPAPVLDKLGEYRDHEFLTRDLFDTAVFGAIKDAGVTDPTESKRLRGQIFAQAENRKVVGNLFSIFRANTPQLFVDINRAQCQTMGVNPNDVFSTLQIYLGSYYV